MTTATGEASGGAGLVGVFLQRLAEFREAVRGDPGAVYRAAQQLEADATRLTALGDRFGQEVGAAKGGWQGDAAALFADKASSLGTELGAQPRLLRGGAAALTRVAPCFDQARTSVETVMTSFRAQAMKVIASAQAYANTPLPGGLPPAVATEYRGELVATARRWMDAMISRLGHQAIGQAQDVEARLNDQLAQTVAELRRNLPTGSLASLGRGFRADVRGADGVGASRFLIPDRSLTSLFGQSTLEPWDSRFGLSIPPATLGSIGLGMPASALVTATVFKAPWGNALARIPGNTAGDMINLALLQSSNNGVYFFQDPTANRFASAGAAALLNPGFNELLLAGARRLGTNELVLDSDGVTFPIRYAWADRQAGLQALASDPVLSKLPMSDWPVLPVAAHLKPGTLAAMPLLIEGGNWALDQWGPKVSATDPNDNNFWGDLWLRSGTVGAGVSGPVLAETRNPQAAAWAFGVPTLQQAAGRWLFGAAPPHADTDWAWNLGTPTAGGRALVSSIGDGVSSLDYHLRRGSDPSAGAMQSLVSNWSNNTAGVASGLLSLKHPLFSGGQLIDQGRVQFAQDSFARGHDAMNRVLYRYPDPSNIGDVIVHSAANGVAGVVDGVTGNFGKAGQDFRRVVLDPSAYPQQQPR